MVRDTGIEPVTSSVSGKRSPAELIARGGNGNRTRVHGFAGRCLTTRPPHRTGQKPNLRADDGIRTRDPHLGKVMRYQLRYIRMLTRFAFRSPWRAKRTLADDLRDVQIRWLTVCPRMFSVVRGRLFPMGRRPGCVCALRSWVHPRWPDLPQMGRCFRCIWPVGVRLRDEARPGSRIRNLGEWRARFDPADSVL